tara:strand:- start:539 stop:949 length:411 start_codon:yes stop_codon:yes gene_type:complete
MSLIDKIKEHEGFRSTVYQCTAGHDTIGFGFAIKDLELDLDIAEEILKRKLDKLMKKVHNRFSWVDHAPYEIQLVIYNMCYQMGISGFSKFKKTIEYLSDKNYDKASKEMLDSRWARQTPNRAIELSNIVKAQSNE